MPVQVRQPRRLIDPSFKVRSFFLAHGGIGFFLFFFFTGNRETSRICRRIPFAACGGHRSFYGVLAFFSSSSSFFFGCAPCCTNGKTVARSVLLRWSPRSFLHFAIHCSEPKISHSDVVRLSRGEFYYFFKLRNRVERLVGFWVSI